MKLVAMKHLACVLLCVSPGLAAGCVSRSSPDVKPLIAEGRAQLDAGRTDEALALFEEAARADGSLQTRMWVLRSWLEQGRNNDTLDALDELVDEGQSGPDMDYLYGMAFALRGRQHLSDGVTDSSVKMNFVDAVGRLEAAVRVDEERYRDAFEPLAQAALYTGELERARRAAKKAVEHYPDDPLAWLTRGHVALALFKVEQEVEEWGPRAERQWAAADEAFGKSIAAFGQPSEEADQVILSDAATYHGHTLMWKQRRDDAADAYATAMTWSPDTVDYLAIRGIFDAPERDTGAPGPETAHGKQTELRTFNRALEGGARGFVAELGEDDPRGVSLYWWLGYSRLELGDYEGAEEAFATALAKDPEAANAWFYTAMARYLRQDHAGAVAALRAGWEVNPTALVDEMKLDPANYVARLEVLTGWAYGEERLTDCALLAEICAETALKEERHWHNLGIFLREEARRQKEGEAPDEEALAELGQRSLEAHMRALALAPEDPQVVNDTAVVMHYYVEQDLPLALKMYEQAIELANRRLAEEELAESERARFEAARDDAAKNLELLKAKLDG